jgi:CDGSH-type Zn-finger protein
MSEQLDIFGGNSVVQVGPSKVAKAEKVVQSKTTNKTRYGVCECGRKGWPLKVENHVLYRLCGCGRKERV